MLCFSNFYFLNNGDYYKKLSHNPSLSDMCRSDFYPELFPSQLQLPSGVMTDKPEAFFPKHHVRNVPQDKFGILFLLIEKNLFSQLLKLKVSPLPMVSVSVEDVLYKNVRAEVSHYSPSLS